MTSQPIRPPLLIIIGASGYIGRHLVARAGPAWRVVGTHLASTPPAGLESYALDVRDRAAVAALLDRLRPDVVIHTAYRYDDASVDVDGAPGMAAACADVGARLLFMSTDLVFDGRRGWYTEADPPNPVMPYGVGKAAAERAVLDRGGTIVRTSTVFGFDPLDSITRRLVVEPLRRGGRSPLFVDEFRCPTYAPDLAAALLELAVHSYPGVLHLAGPQRLSRYDLGMRLAVALGLDARRLAPTHQADSGLTRPADTSLDTGLARRLLRTRIRSVDEAVAEARVLDVPPS